MCRTSAQLAGALRLCFVLLICCVSAAFAKDESWSRWVCVNKNEIEECVQEDPCKTAYRGKIECYVENTKVSDRVCENAKLPRPKPSTAACESRISDVTISFINETTAEVAYIVPDPTVTVQSGDFVFILTDLSYFVATPSLSCSAPVKCVVDGMSIRATMPTSHSSLSRTVFYVYGVLLGGSLDARISIRVHHSHAPMWNLYYGTNAHLGLLRISTYHPDFSSAHLVSTGTARYIAIFAQNDPDVPFVPDTIRSVVFTVGPLSVDPSAPRPGNALRPTYTRGVPTKSLIVEHCSASWREKGGNAWFISDGVSPPAVWRFTAARGHEFQLPSRSLVSGVAIFCRISPPPQVENSPGPAPSADDIDFVFSSVPIAVWLRAVDGSLFAPSTAPQRSLSASRGGDEHYVFVMSPLFRGEAPKPLRNLDSVLQTPTWISANGPRMTVAFQLEAEKRPLGAAFLAQGLSAPLMNYLNSTYLPGIAEATMEYPAYYGPYGTWVCSSNGKPAACVFSNGCGQTTSPVMCMIGGQPSLLGDAPCAWSPLPSSTLGCGAFRCRNGRGNFVPCDDKTLCFPGCDDIPRTVSKEHHGVAPFIPVCVLNGKEVDPDAFCPSHLVQPEFPASCLSRDDCTEACFDIDGLYTSCDNRNSWSLCNPVSKSDNRTVEIQQLACIDKNAPDLRTTPIFPYSFCTGAYPSEWREPPERPCTIYSCMSALREFRWLCSISEDQKGWTACGPDNWAPCSSDCGEGTAQRDYTCGEVNCKGDVVQVGVRDSFCAFKPTPEKTKRCERRECTNHVWMCSDPVKGGSELTPCETAELECPLCTEGGELVRTVVCQLKDTQTTLDDSQCKGARPVAARICPASKKTCSVDFTSKTCSASALGTPEIGLNVTAGIDCLPQNGNIPEIFKVGDCVDELGRPVPRKLCSESLVKKCDLPVCESRPLWMCAREGGGFLEATECTDKSTFACPESDCGCTTVRRSVLCMLDSLVVDDRLCTDVRPSSSFRCPLRTSACKASFDTPTMCFAHTVNNFGESETKNFTKCIPPELALEATISASCYSPTLATTGCKGCGIACPPPVSDFGFNRVYVPQEWCGSLTEPRRCPLPICESPAYTLAWDVEEGACVDDDDHCSSYAKNIIRCVALEGNSTAFEVPDASCDASTRPPLFTPCPGRALCAFGKCMTSPLDDFGHASNSTVTVRVGKCRCDPGYFGPSCDQTFQLARTWMVPAIEDYAAGNLRIAWDVTHADALGTAAVSANAINSSFSTYFAFAPATDGSVALPVSELLSFLKPGPVVFIVTIGGLSLNVTADLPPLCAPLLNKPCSNHGFCNSVTSKCDCTDGYAGDQCQLSLCEAKQCNPQHSSCFVEDNVANCGCARSLSLALFADSRCNELIDCAHTRVCQNGATHAGVLLDGKVVCAGCFCQNRFVGPTCSSCGLHGVCVNGRPNQECSKCVCDSGFFGPICDCHYIFITVLFSQTSEASRLSRTLNGKSLSRWLNGLAKAVQVVSGLRHVSLNYNSSQHLKTDSDNEMGGAYFEVTFRVDYPCSIPEPTPERLHSASVMSGPSGKAVSDDLNRVRDALFSNELRRLPPFEGLDPFAGVSFAEPACDEAYGECPRDVGGGAVPVKIVPPITPEPEPRPTKRKSLTGLEISIIMLCIILIPCFCVIIYLGTRSCREDSRKQEPVQLSPRVTASAPVEKNTFNENPTS